MIKIFSEYYAKGNMNSNEGEKLITFSGIDGSGKSTQSKIVRDRLKNYSDNVYLENHKITSNGFFCNTFSNIYGRIDNSKIDQDYLSFVIAFEYYGYFYEKIKPLLLNGYAILDRFVYDLYASNTSIFNVNYEKSWNILETLGWHGCNLWLDVPPEVAYERIVKRNEKIKFHEQYDNLMKKHMKYMELCERGLIIRVDGLKNSEEVSEDIWYIVAKHLNL